MTAQPPTADRLRHDISRGKSAAGNAPSLEELRIAATTAHSKSSDDRTFGVGSFYAAAVIAIAVIVLAVLTMR
jgi:hypothetical protein